MNKVNIYYNELKDINEYVKNNNGLKDIKELYKKVFELVDYTKEDINYYFYNKYKYIYEDTKENKERLYQDRFKNGLIKKYSKDSFLRKPNPGMILNALSDFNLKTVNCFMIGDSRSDYLAAKRANVNFQYKKKCNLFDQVQTIYNKYFI
jgi:HAD superfamily hydrolase (TIGR01549 family)